MTKQNTIVDQIINITDNHLYEEFDVLFSSETDLFFRAEIMKLALMLSIQKNNSKFYEYLITKHNLHSDSHHVFNSLTHKENLHKEINDVIILASKYGNHDIIKSVVNLKCSHASINNTKISKKDFKLFSDCFVYAVEQNHIHIAKLLLSTTDEMFNENTYMTVVSNDNVELFELFEKQGSYNYLNTNYIKTIGYCDSINIAKHIVRENIKDNKVDYLQFRMTQLKDPIEQYSKSIKLHDSLTTLLNSSSDHKEEKFIKKHKV